MTEWVMVPREPTAVQLIDGSYEIPDPISHLGERTARSVYRAMLDAAPAAPVQAEPVAQIGWADEFGNLFPMGAWKPAQRTWRDSHKSAWRPVFLHPPAAEVQGDKT